MRWRLVVTSGLLALGLVAGCATSDATSGPAAVLAPQSKSDPPVQLPNREGSLKFAVFGDFGTASTQQYELAAQMDKLQQRFPFELVLLAGDNMYGADRPQDFVNKFETPYKPLLDRKVKFYASLGNHDDRNQRYDLRLREALEPMFVQHNVSVVFAGHDHFYERVKPQKGIAHFVTGSGGQLRRGDLEAGSPITAKGFDTDYAFLAAEVIDDQLYFNAISRTGEIVDSGIILRRQPLEAAAGAR